MADRLPLLQRPHSFYHGTGFQSRNRTLDSARFPGYNKNRRGRRDKRSARFGEIFIRNRHFAEWRFLPFIRIVTVYPRICNVMVIGIASPPFGWCGRPPAVVAAPALILSWDWFPVNHQEGIFPLLGSPLFKRQRAALLHNPPNFPWKKRRNMLQY